MRSSNGPGGGGGRGAGGFQRRHFDAPAQPVVVDNIRDALFPPSRRFYSFPTSAGGPPSIAATRYEHKAQTPAAALGEAAVERGEDLVDRYSGLALKARNPLLLVASATGSSAASELLDTAGVGSHLLQQQQGAVLSTEAARAVASVLPTELRIFEQRRTPTGGGVGSSNTTSVLTVTTTATSKLHKIRTAKRRKLEKPVRRGGVVSVGGKVILGGSAGTGGSSTAARSSSGGAAAGRRSAASAREADALVDTEAGVKRPRDDDGDDDNDGKAGGETSSEDSLSTVDGASDDDDKMSAGDLASDGDDEFV